MGLARSVYRKSKSAFKWYRSVNWTKTIYFNFKMFPFATAKKLPVFFYGSVKFGSLKGKITINVPLKKGMVGFGQPYEIISRSKRTAELVLDGELTVNGAIQFGIDYFIYVTQNAKLEMGHMSSLGNNGKIICYHSIRFGDFARIGFESQLMDSTFHQMIHTTTGEKLPFTKPITIGNYNYFGNRISVMPDTVTPDYCTVASNSVCNKDYSNLGQNILIGGIPAKLLRQNISRDWKGEAADLEKWLTVKL